jgi:hypothetical protein
VPRESDVSATATASHETGATRACAVHGRLRALVIPARRPRCTSLARPLMGARRLTHAPSSPRQQRMHTAAMIACQVLRVSQAGRGLEHAYPAAGGAQAERFAPGAAEAWPRKGA